MLFHSFPYFVFILLVFTIYWALSQNFRRQNLLLLAASFVFYGWWDWRFLFLIIFSSSLDFYIGLALDTARNNQIKKRWLFLSVFANLGLLAVFKYFNFFSESFAQLMSFFGWNVDAVTLNIILPVGISFYTFQSMSYTIDIYRQKIKPTKNIIAFFTFIAFFPQLVAGPIERASNLLPQLLSVRVFKLEKFKAGLFQIFVGLFRKVIIADNLGVYVNAVYGNIERHDTSTLVLATLFFAFQIYYDFAGYSDMAIGSAKLLGFDFKKNFDLPYFSKSLTEFWRRWHISLSTWLRDYLYIPLGGNRKGRFLTYRNLLITMLLGGLWHGSSATFIIWGGIHGLALVIEKRFFGAMPTVDGKCKIYGDSSLFLPVKIGLRWCFTFGTVVLAWVFFRAENLDDALLILQNIFRFNISFPFIGNHSTFWTAITMCGLGIAFDIFLFQRNKSAERLGGELTNFKLTLIISLLILFIALFYASSVNFIYFQF